MTLIRRCASLLLAGLLGAATVGSTLAAADDLQLAKSATARFNSLTQAAKLGYGLPPAGPLHECIASFDGTGAMGYHYVNGSLIDTVLDPARPEALVYAPDPNGNLTLAALEYVVFAEPWMAEHGTEMPMVLGQELMLVEAPNRYELPAFFALHAWIWKPNPTGTFANFNPAVSCPA
jgi:hypothetical protein